MITLINPHISNIWQKLITTINKHFFQRINVTRASVTLNVSISKIINFPNLIFP